MKRLICFVVVLCLIKGAKAQNLVPNPSFELDTACGSISSLYHAIPWFQPCNYLLGVTLICSSDLYDTCSYPSTAGVPLNLVGFQQPKTGHSYAGIFVNDLSQNYREYIEVPLTTTLLANKTYCVGFYVSLADTSHKAISNFGAYFSIDSLLDGTSGNAIDYVTPQVENPASNMLSNKNNWMLVSGMFTATGGEKFMTIGNFHTDSASNIQTLTTGTGDFAYYYIDDISVVRCNVGIDELTTTDNLQLYPNPATNEITITSNHPLKTLHIYNVLEQCVLRQQPTTNNQPLTIDISGFAKGIYYIEAETAGSAGSPQGKGVMRKKFVKE